MQNWRDSCVAMAESDNGSVELFGENENYDQEHYPLQTSGGSDIESEPEDADREARVGPSNALLKELFSKRSETQPTGATPDGNKRGKVMPMPYVFAGLDR